MELGSRYKDMATFRLAMRQFAIKKDFELGIEYASPIKYIDYCKGGDCLWSINAREETKGSPAIVVCFILMQGKFKKAYAREVEQLADRSYWHEVEIVAYVGAPLLKRVVRQQRKNRMKGCLEGRSGKKASGNETEKTNKKDSW
jgi:hypothetical protein